MRSKFKWIFTLLVAFTMQFSFAQEKTVTGIVSDELGPAIGATVTVKGTKNVVATDFDGKYSIKAKSGDVLLVSYLGMKQSVTVGSANSYNVSLKSVELKEVVVVAQEGYKTISKAKQVSASKTITSETLENRPNANILNTLQGQLAGVNVSSGSGQPGTRPTIVIRGVGTITGSTDPLYVIDGFPSTVDNYRSMNPNDFESITVLKDAAALSAYGNRGSNGVILINTKKAKFGEGKTKFRYSSNYGIVQLQDARYNPASGIQMLELQRLRGVGYGANPVSFDQFKDVNTNWMNVFFRQAATSDHNLTVENSNKNMSNFTSFSYSNQEGILQNTGLNRFTGRNNLNGRSENEKFTYMVNTAVGYSRSNLTGNLGDGAVNRNYVLGGYLSLPFLSPDRYQGSVWTLNEYNNTPGLETTPYMLMDRLLNFDRFLEEVKLDFNSEFSYKVKKDLTARIRLNGTYINARENEYEMPNSFNALLFSTTPGVTTFDGGDFQGYEDIRGNREFYFNNLYQLAYSKNYKKHSIDVSVNMEYNHSRLNTNFFRQRGLNPMFFIPNTGQGYVADVSTNDNYVPQIGANSLRRDGISYFGLLDYDFDSFLGFTASFRRDGSSIFNPGYQFNNTWSVGGRINLDKMEFLKDYTAINALKLRASYGTTGNDRILGGSAFAGIVRPLFIDSWAQSNNAYNGQFGLAGALGFPGLSWETVNQFNVGIDYAFFQSRIRGAVEYYNRVTNDLYYAVPISAVTGQSTLRQNSEATVTNSGFELDIAGDLIRNEDVKLTLRFNTNYNKNVVNGIVENNGRLISGNFITQNGGAIDEVYRVPYAGVNPVNGNLLFVSRTGELTENPFDVDRVATGKNNLPTFQGGFGFDFSYKGLFLNTLFSYVTDVWRMDFDEAGLYDSTRLNQFVVSRDLINAWTPTNTSSNIPRLGATNEGYASSDRFLRDASFLRMRNIQLGYKVNKNFLKKTFFSDVVFTLQAENLFTFTKWNGFDAESNRVADQNQYPTPRIYTFGIDLKF